MTMYYQCRLTCPTGETVGWIEARGAKKGAQVELLTADGKFWTVAEVYKPGLTQKALQTKQANDRNSLPSIIGQAT